MDVGLGELGESIRLEWKDSSSSGRQRATPEEEGTEPEASTSTSTAPSAEALQEAGFLLHKVGGRAWEEGNAAGCRDRSVVHGCHHPTPHAHGRRSARWTRWRASP
jgi:hypothetical protein